MNNENGMIAWVRKAVWVRQMLLACLVCVSLGLQTSCKDDDDEIEVINSNLPPVDRNFVVNAAQSNLSEIDMGNLALQKATNADVKAFAQNMVTMHTNAQNQLKTLGTTKNITIPDQLDEEHKAIRDRLNGLSGVEFDKAYINTQITGHQKTSAMMQTEIDNGQDNELKSYATVSKPVVDQHLTQAQEIKTENNL